LLGTVFVPAFAVNSARADASDTAREVVNGVIQDVIENVRDRVRLGTRPPGRPLGFNGEDSARASIYDEAFSALAYAGIPTKANKGMPAGLAPKEPMRESCAWASAFKEAQREAEHS
jgi:hypothetical protein